MDSLCLDSPDNELEKGTVSEDEIKSMLIWIWKTDAVCVFSKERELVT